MSTLREKKIGLNIVDFISFRNTLARKGICSSDFLYNLMNKNIKRPILFIFAIYSFVRA